MSVDLLVLITFRQEDAGGGGSWGRTHGGSDGGTGGPNGASIQVNSGGYSRKTNSASNLCWPIIRGALRWDGCLFLSVDGTGQRQQTRMG